MRRGMTGPDMEQEPTPFIEYAAPVSTLAARTTQGALRLGAIALALGIVPVLLFLLLRSFHVGRSDGAIAAILWNAANVFGLLLGGIGWAGARHFRPNGGYTLCVWANVLNWIGLGIFYAVLTVAIRG